MAKGSIHISVDEQIQQLSHGAQDIHSLDGLKEKLALGRPLRVKAGFDPTRPDLHLGHVVLLRKLRQFQDLGHQVVFLVGDFTAQIGDPSGRNSTRPVPTREEIEHGARTYAEQAFKVLDPEKTETVHNSTWLEAMNFSDVIRLAGKYTLARMMERDDFQNRFAQHQSISVHELLYPLAQAYDSVAIDADVELGGTDQLFNLLVGREIMRDHGKAPQIVMTTPILEGTNAREENGRILGDKMSKSLDNYVGVAEPPLEQFGKLMSIADGVMWRYYDLLSVKNEAEVKALKAKCSEGANPRDAKLALAQELVAHFHSESAARDAQEQWIAQFSNRQVPESMPEVTVPLEQEAGMWLVRVLSKAGLAKSNADARRRVEQGAVHVDGTKVSDPSLELNAGTYTLRAGKRAWAKVTLTP